MIKNIFYIIIFITSLSILLHSQNYTIETDSKIYVTSEFNTFLGNRTFTNMSQTNVFEVISLIPDITHFVAKPGDSKFIPSKSYSGWQVFNRNSTFTIPNIEGLHKIPIWFADIDGNISLYVKEILIDTTPPDTPQNVYGYFDNKSFHIKWDEPEEKETSFFIIKSLNYGENKDNIWKVVGVVSSNYIVDKDALPDYIYRVFAFDKLYNISEASDVQIQGKDDIVIKEHNINFALIPRKPYLDKDVVKSAQDFTLRYIFDQKETVSIYVYDKSGNLVKTLTKDKVMYSGDYKNTWNLTDNNESRVKGGMYFIKMIGEDWKSYTSFYIF